MDPSPPSPEPSTTAETPTPPSDAQDAATPKPELPPDATTSLPPASGSTSSSGGASDPAIHQSPQAPTAEQPTPDSADPTDATILDGHSLSVDVGIFHLHDGGTQLTIGSNLEEQPLTAEEAVVALGSIILFVPKKYGVVRHHLGEALAAAQTYAKRETAEPHLPDDE